MRIGAGVKPSVGTWLAWLALAAGGTIPIQPASAATPGYTTPGLSAAQLARLPGVSYARPLMEMPERTLVVLYLDFPPARGASAANPWACHRPPGPVTLRVTKGALRLGLDGRAAQILRAGGTLYEPAQSLHSVAANASGAEPATAVAVIVVPKAAPILLPDGKCGAGPRG